MGIGLRPPPILLPVGPLGAISEWHYAACAPFIRQLRWRIAGPPYEFRFPLKPFASTSTNSAKRRLCPVIDLPICKRNLFVCFPQVSGADRKSTRLNSSHHSISYAV